MGVSALQILRGSSPFVLPFLCPQLWFCSNYCRGPTHWWTPAGQILGCPDPCDPCGVDAYDCEIPQILTMCVHSTWRRYTTNVLGIQTHKLVIESTLTTRPKYRHKTNIKTRRNSPNHCAYFHATWCWQTTIVCSIRTCELQRHVASPRQNIDTKRMSNP